MSDVSNTDASEADLERRMRNELLWIYDEVWPLVHSLTTRQVIKDRFRKLPDLINTFAPVATSIRWPSDLAVAGMAREAWGNPIPKEAYRFADVLRRSVERLDIEAKVSPTTTSRYGAAGDVFLLDAAGKKQVSYGPRRLEIKAPVAHVEACLPAEAVFWGVYKHDAEGLASIVGDAHDQHSAKAFAEQMMHITELEARLAAASPPSPPRVVVVMEGERIQSILADTPVEVTGLNYDDDEMDEAENNGLNVVKVPQDDGTVERAVIGAFPVEVNPVETARIIALDVEEDLALRRVVLAIDTKTAAFKDLGYAWEVARLLRDAGRQLQTSPDMDSIRLVDTNDNVVGRLYATDVLQDLESPGMIHLVVEAGKDQTFGTMEADRMALAETFRRLGDQLDGVMDLTKRFTAFTVEVREAPYTRNSRITSVKVGQFHYIPSPEPEEQSTPLAAVTPEN